MTRLAAGAVLVGLLFAAPLRAADLPEIKQRGALRVLAIVDTRAPEFFSLKSQASPGFDVEILLGFAKAQKVELKVVPATGWAALVPALVEGSGDLVAGRFGPTPARRRLIEFTQEVFPSRSVVVTRKPHPGVPTVEQLKAEHVGTVPGTSMYEALLDLGLPPGKIESTLTSGDLSEALRSGKITAAVWWLDAAIQAQRQDPSLQIGLSLGLPEGLAYGVRREDRALLEALNQHLQVVRTSGNWNRLAVKYFGDATATILGRAKQE